MSPTTECSPWYISRGSQEVAVSVPVVEKTAEEIKAELYWNYVGLLGGVAEALMGMILFSIGLTYGFTSIGDQVILSFPPPSSNTPA